MNARNLPPWAGGADGTFALPSDAASRPPKFTDLSVVLLLSAAAIMFFPTFYDLLFGGIWAAADYSHGPFVLAIALWLLYQRWEGAPSGIPYQANSLSGLLLIAVAALTYVPARILSLRYVEAADFIVCLTGIVLIVGGTKLLAATRFPLFFLIFMIPLPDFLVSSISSLLKVAVSITSVHVLTAFQFPVARNGVIIFIGPYQLLVADACAGIRTLFMLEALGLLYLNVVKYHSVLRNILLAILIVPISFAANVARVILLALITYYWGDEAGEGFLHEFAGISLFLLGLLSLLFVDGLLRLIGRRFRTAI
jgi:exosortase B